MSFYLGNFLACFVPGTENRRKVRSTTVKIFYSSRIKRFIKNAYGEDVKSIQYIRQITLNRVVFLINNKYYVKIFRNVSNQALKDYNYITEYIRPYLSVKIPKIKVDDKWSMYACRKIKGHPIDDFTKDEVLANKNKIQDEVFAILEELQSIDVRNIPGHDRFLDSMQRRTIEKPAKKEKEVLAHFDLNEGNLFFDDDLNVTAVIDWDTISIAHNPETDKQIFMKYWNNYCKN